MAACIGKKVINSAEKAVADCLEGFTLLHKDVLLMKKHKVIVRRDVEKLKQDGKVCLISGGGSGHEPAHAGYVGQGMLTAAVCGEVFASPPSSAVLTAIEACSSPAGVLLIVKNYTGDRLNFGKAAEVAKNRGIRVEMVMVAEDCALTSRDKTAGRRGLCGTIFIHKIAGAMAENGASLNEILTTVNQAKSLMGTISISLSPCSVPGQAPTFQIPDDIVEFGLGIHGEAGIKKVQMASAQNLVKQMIDHLLNSEFMPKLEKKAVAIIVNNLGGTSNLELNIMSGEFVKYISSCGITVERCYSGAMMTSLEMAGVSLTILECSQKILGYLDQETAVTAWPKCGKISDYSDCFLVDASIETTPMLEPMTAVQGSEDVVTCLMNVCDDLIENKDKLNQLDRASGDGDCGTTFERGATAIKDCLSSPDGLRLPVSNPEELALALANLLESSMGGSSGAILSLFLTASANSFKSGTSNDAFLQSMLNGIEAVKFYGGADVGDRTLLDSLSPAADAFKANVNLVFSDAIQLAARAASDAAAKTASMTAKAGRSSYVSKESLTESDPGAVAIAIIFASISKSLSR